MEDENFRIFLHKPGINGMNGIGLKKAVENRHQTGRGGKARPWTHDTQFLLRRELIGG